MIDRWEAEEGGGRLVGLLRRYSGACMGGRLLKQLQQEAEVAALEIVAALLCGELIYIYIGLHLLANGNLRWMIRFLILDSVLCSACLLACWLLLLV